MKILHLSQFLDYRTFLAAHAEEQKRRNPRWSYGAWAKRLGLGGTATITRIVQGDRNPGPKLVDKLVAYFNFSPLEGEYFRNLVRMGRRDHALGETSPLWPARPGHQPEATESKHKEHRAFETISNWYVLAIRELTRIAGARLDPNWIAENFFFGVTPRQAAHALRLLCEGGLISIDPEGRATKTEAPLQAPQEHTAEALCRYHEEMLNNAKKSLRLKDLQNRVTTALTLVLQQEQIDAAMALIDEFRSKMANLTLPAQGDTLYQVQVQFFPLVRNSA